MWTMRRCPRPTRWSTASPAPRTSSLLIDPRCGTPSGGAADDDGRAVRRDRLLRAVRQPVADGEDPLDPELEQLLELGPLGRGVVAADDDDGPVVPAARLGLDGVEHVRGHRVVQVEHEDPDGAGAPGHEGVRGGVAPVPDLLGGREDELAGLGRDPGRVLQGERHQRLRDPGPGRDVADRRTARALEAGVAPALRHHVPRRWVATPASWAARASRTRVELAHLGHPDLPEQPTLGPVGLPDVDDDDAGPVVAPGLLDRGLELGDGGRPRRVARPATPRGRRSRPGRRCSGRARHGACCCTSCRPGSRWSRSMTAKPALSQTMRMNFLPESTEE